MTAQRAHNGFSLPAIGLGTYQLNGSAGAAAVSEAVRGGYRLLDSAFRYENEGAVGRGARDSGADRASLIVTSKLPGRHHEHDAALRTIEESVYRTGLDAIDLYLIHWPNPITDRYVEAWGALLEARERGLVRQVGVSNFLPEHIERLERETGVLPVVNQIEVHPFFPQQEALDYHRERGIITEAWSPVGRGREPMHAEAVAEIAAARGISPVQAILAWHVARGVVPLPKSQNPDRQRENLAAAEIRLSDAEIDAITALGRPDGRLAGQDPAVYEEF
ncbi:2,5-diketo-D-gluconic acid reductase [Leucobacter sp. UCD-THU]|uniref:aldo/keto reductase n=1 Tax=Leucobacter sp. UCD-THU TaxID=1292023 RepID=UPI00038183D7|nr:aldo/keto reductase [Leucobacter sp. UCD-THU]EYT56302.1 2,5-diketo-D-gluconic acid reductase [Leucobacter sp. UCD-THU]